MFIKLLVNTKSKKYTYFPRLLMMHHFAAIATCRYLGTFRPFIYTTWVTPRMVTITSVSAVAYSFFLPTWLTMAHYRREPVEICTSFTLCVPWALLIMSCHTYVLLVAIAYVYQRILREALRIKRQISAAVPESFQKNESDNESDSDATRLQENMNVIKNFAIIVGTSFLVWVPHQVISNYLGYRPSLALLNPGIQRVVVVKGISLSLIPVLNPIIYATRLKWFRVMLQYIKGTISYKECEESMSDIWPDVPYPPLSQLLDIRQKDGIPRWNHL